VPVPPKPASKRRRRNKPASYGLAEPTTAPAARQPDALGFDAGPLVQSLWDALADSCEARFYSAVDWERVRLELWYADAVMKRPTAASWSAVQSGLNALMISPIEKRKLGVELTPPDPAEDAAVLSLLGKYQEQLKPE
jgi:hypothetical protein